MALDTDHKLFPSKLRKAFNKSGWHIALCVGDMVRVEDVVGEFKGINAVPFKKAIYIILKEPKRVERGKKAPEHDFKFKSTFRYNGIEVPIKYKDYGESGKEAEEDYW